LRPDDGGVKSLLLFFVENRTEVVPSDYLAVVRVAGEDEKDIGKRCEISHVPSLPGLF
jgi:hypothetical protein